MVLLRVAVELVVEVVVVAIGDGVTGWPLWDAVARDDVLFARVKSAFEQVSTSSYKIVF